MPSCTEILTFPLKPGASLDPSTESGAVLAGCLKELLEQPGVERAYWGTEVENPGIMRLFADWTSLQKHKDFMAAPIYGPFIARLQALVGGAPSMFHVDFPESAPAKSCLGPGTTTEVLAADFPAGISAATKATVSESVRGFVAKMLAAPGGPRAASVGWAVETDVPSAKDAGVTGARLVALVAWPDVAAHEAFRETPAFKENIGVLRTLPELQGTSLAHVQAQVEQPV